MITAGGAMFAAFPNWYATLFSGFYMALILMLLALIVRGVAFEFRSKVEDTRWRTLWDWVIFGGSLIPALLWGVAMANLIRGVQIDASMTYVGTFFDLLNPYALLGGVATLMTFVLHGAIFLTLKIEGTVEERAHNFAKRFWPFTAAMVFGFVITGYFFATDMFLNLGVNPGVVPLTAGVALLLTGYFLHQKRNGWAFAMTGVTIVFSTITIFMGLFPRVMVSSLDPAYSLTIYNAASSPYTLRVMTIVVLIFLPIVLVYQGWTYWIFRKRLTTESHLEY
jgi:cytochrome d ubiquinol oxidase subunit II